MALFCRIKKVKSINIFNHFKRFYFQNHTPRLITNHTNSKSQSIFDYYNNSYYQFTNAPKNQEFRDSRVRFFAAPVQAVKEEVKLSRPRLNDEITSNSVRLVTNEGHTVISRREAQQRANELKFDLVEVDPKSNPPVCRLMDYHREMYNKKVKGKERSKTKSTETLKKDTKEVRFSVKAELKDIKIKADTVKRLMERGYRVKCTALASEGRDLGGLLAKMSAMIEDVALVESGPILDEKQGYMIVRHIKFGPPKKGNKSSKGKSGTQKDSSAGCDGDGDADSEEQTFTGESSIDYDNEDSESDLDDEVKTPLRSQKAQSSSRISYDNENKFDNRRPSSTIRSDASTFTPSHAPNASSVPQPENRYAKKVLNNASPNQPQPQPDNRYAKKVPNNASPNIGSQPQPQPDNRYAKKVPNNASPNIGSQPQPDNRYAKKVPNTASPNIESQSQPQPDNRYVKKVSNNPLRTPNIGSQPQRQPRVDIPDKARQSGNNFSAHLDRPKPPSFTGNNTPKSTSFGIFSGVKADDIGQGVAGKPVLRGNVNSPTSKSDGSPAGDDKKWGIFSGGNTASGTKV